MSRGLVGGGAVDVLRGSDAVEEGLGAVGLDEARGDGVHADAVGCELVGETLAVGRERGFGGGVGEGRVVERHAALD